MYGVDALSVIPLGTHVECIKDIKDIKTIIGAMGHTRSLVLLFRIL